MIFVLSQSTDFEIASYLSYWFLMFSGKKTPKFCSQIIEQKLFSPNKIFKWLSHPHAQPYLLPNDTHTYNSNSRRKSFRKGRKPFSPRLPAKVAQRMNYARVYFPTEFISRPGSPVPSRNILKTCVLLRILRSHSFHRNRILKTMRKQPNLKT